MPIRRQTALPRRDLPRLALPSLALFLTTLLGGCAPGLPAFPALGPVAVTTLYRAPQSSGAPQTCWGKTTASGQSTAKPPPPADADRLFHIETTNTGSTEPPQLWFQTLCAPQLTPAFIATLQRALAARNLYDGPVTGQMTPATQAAIRAYQHPLGLESEQLSLAAARQMGLIDLGLEPAG